MSRAEPGAGKEADASRPLLNPRHERFAQALVNTPRISGLDAWAQSGSADAPRENRDSLKSAAARVRRRPEVRARIGWLTAERRRRAADAANGKPTVRSLEELMHRLSDALTRVHERAEAENAPDGLLLKLRRTLTAHASRLSAQLERLRKADRGAPCVADDEFDVAEMLRRFPAAPCTCSTEAGR